MRGKKSSFLQLIQKNKEEIKNDYEAIKRIEERIDNKYQIKIINKP